MNLLYNMHMHKHMYIYMYMYMVQIVTSVYSLVYMHTAPTVGIMEKFLLCGLIKLQLDKWKMKVQRTSHTSPHTNSMPMQRK